MQISVMRSCRYVLPLGSAVMLCACVTAPPLGPSIAVMPKPGESFTVFQQHDLTCRSYASRSSGQLSTQQTQSNQVAHVAAGAGIGAAAGALLGDASGHAGNGVAIGAGAGLLAGVLSGAQGTQRARAVAQQHYDTSYAQCMAANGEQLPKPPAPVQRVIYVTPPLPPPPPVVIYPAG